MERDDNGKNSVEIFSLYQNHIIFFAFFFCPSNLTFLSFFPSSFYLQGLPTFPFQLLSHQAFPYNSFSIHASITMHFPPFHYKLLFLPSFPLQLLSHKSFIYQAFPIFPLPLLSHQAFPYNSFSIQAFIY